MEKEFDHIENLENAVRWDYFKRILNWPIEKIAYEMYQNDKRLLEWANKRASTITALIKAEPERVKKIRKGLEKEYVPTAGETKEEAIKREKIEKLNIQKVVREFIKGKSLADLARIFKVDFNDFRLWWNQNISVINQQVSQLRNRE